MFWEQCSLGAITLGALPRYCVIPSMFVHFYSFVYIKTDNQKEVNGRSQRSLYRHLPWDDLAQYMLSVDGLMTTVIAISSFDHLCICSSLLCHVLLSPFTLYLDHDTVATGDDVCLILASASCYTSACATAKHSIKMTSPELFEPVIIPGIHIPQKEMPNEANLHCSIHDAAVIVNVMTQTSPQSTDSLELVSSSHSHASEA